MKFIMILIMVLSLFAMAFSLKGIRAENDTLRNKNIELQAKIDSLIVE